MTDRDSIVSRSCHIVTYETHETTDPIIRQYLKTPFEDGHMTDRDPIVSLETRGGGLGSRPIFKKFHETYAPS